MAARIKVFLGMLLMTPGVAAVITILVYRFDNPSLTETQLFNDTGWMLFGALLLAVPGLLLLQAGMEEEGGDE